MAVARGNAASLASNASPTTITNFVVTEVSPLFVAIAWQGGQTISSVTWNGEALTQLGSTINQSAGTGKIAVYAIKNPTATTANIVVTFSSAPASVAGVFVVGTTGGDTTTGWRTIYTRNDAAGAGPGRNVDDSQSGDLILHAASVWHASAPKEIVFDAGEDTSTNGTSQINNMLSNSQSAGLSTETASGANHPVGCTDASFYAEIAFAVIPASVASGPASVGNRTMKVMSDLMRPIQVGNF